MANYKINTKPGKLPDDAVNKNMNFDKFMSGYKPAPRGFKGIKAVAGTAVATVAVAVAAYFIFHPAAPVTPAAAAPFINPPLKKMDMPPSTFIVNTAADTNLVYTTGSTIVIPQEAFMKADGTPVKGDVQLKYREFHDPIDIIMSGIPMNYDSAGHSYQLESAGMFDISASQDGQPLLLRPGKTLAVNMVSHTNSDDYNVYYLDTVQKRWEYVRENTAANNTVQPIYSIDKEKEKVFLAAHPAEAIPETEKLVAPAKADPAAYNFSIDYKADEFPELAVYNGVKFEIAANDKSYNPKLAERVWDEVAIHRHEDGHHYTITFSSGKEQHSFNASPVVDANNYEAALKDFEYKQSRYELLLRRRQKQEEQMRDSLYRLNSYFMGVASRSNLDERFNAFISGNYAGATKDMLVSRLFTINKLGVWNGDRPWDYFSRIVDKPHKRFHKARFFSAAGVPLLLRSVYLLKRKMNTYIPVFENKFAELPYTKDMFDIFIGITYDNKIVYMKDEDVHALDDSADEFKLRMTDAGENVTTPDQLKALLLF